MAAGYNREVAAYPGRVNDTRSAGCNQLIRTNIAAMITKADDLLELMSWSDSQKKKPLQKQLFINLTPEEEKILAVLNTKEQVHSDELLHATGLPNSQLAATLLQLEMQGIVKTLPGKLYRLY
jgi:DNA processing protein